jgi:hypothetical protein
MSDGTSGTWYDVQLRPDFSVRIRLPDDLTVREAGQLRHYLTGIARSSRKKWTCLSAREIGRAMRKADARFAAFLAGSEAGS